MERIESVQRLGEQWIREPAETDRCGVPLFANWQAESPVHGG